MDHPGPSKSRPEDTRRCSPHTGALLALTVIAGSVWTLWAWLPIERLSGWFTADDMYYYLELVRNIAAGHGPSFDGETLTNGFHPAWAALLTGLTLLVQDATLRVHLALMILVGFSLGSGLLVYRLLLRLSGAPAALAGAALWLLCPWVGAITLTGVEAALSTFLLLVSLLAALPLLQATGRERSPRRALLIGVTMGLACLARTDSVLLCLPLGVALLGRWWATSGFLHTLRRGGLVVAAGTLTLAPWFAWNLVRFGRISQDSSRTIAWHMRSQAQSLELPGGLPRLGAQRVWAWLERAGEVAAGLPAWGLILLLAGVALLAWRRRRDDPAGAILAGVLLCHLLTAAAFYGGYLLYFQNWYFLGPLAGLAILGGWAFGQGRAWLLERKRISAGLPVLVLVLLVAGANIPRAITLHRQGVYPWQAVCQSVAVQLDRQLPGARIGAYNAGIYGYFAELPVVNLDGVVNPEVLEAKQRDDLLGYLDRSGITHLLDSEQTLRLHARGGGPGFLDAFELVYRFEVDGGPNDLILLRRVATPSGE